LNPHLKMAHNDTEKFSRLRALLLHLLNLFFPGHAIQAARLTRRTTEMKILIAILSTNHSTQEASKK
jgi:hypothetical protein